MLYSMARTLRVGAGRGGHGTGGSGHFVGCGAGAPPLKCSSSNSSGSTVGHGVVGSKRSCFAQGLFDARESTQLGRQTLSGGRQTLQQFI